MSALLQAFARYGGLILFLLLEGISFFLIIKYNQEQNRIFFSTTNEVIGSVEETVDGMVKYWKLGKEVARLQEENAQLRDQLDNALYTSSFRRDTTSGDSLMPMFRYIPANVISKSILGVNNTMTLNRGRLQGVEPGFGVVADTGLVGIVVGVSDYYSKVMTILHSQARISASVRGTNHHGSLVWDGKNPQFMQLQAIPSYAGVKEGDIIETSGYSLKFPRGIVIGTVAKVERKSGDNNYFISVKLAKDLTTLQYAYIIDQLMKKDLDKLEGAANEQ